MRVYTLPRRESRDKHSMVLINCTTDDQVRIVAGLCGQGSTADHDSYVPLEQWFRNGSDFVMTWHVYQRIATTGLKAIYEPNYASCITQEDYEEELP